MPHDDPRARIHRLVAAYLDGGSPIDDLIAEPAAIRCGTAIVYIRLVDGEPTVLRLFSPLLRDIERSTELLSELNDINARLSFLRLFWRENAVYAAVELLADAVDEMTFAHAFDTVADAADYYDERLQPRFGGRKAYADREA